MDRSTESLLPTKSLLSGTSPAQSSAAFAAPAQTGPTSEERPIFTTVLLGVGLPRLGWVELAEEMVFGIPLKRGCFGGKTPSLWESRHWCFT